MFFAFLAHEPMLLFLFDFSLLSATLARIMVIIRLQRIGRKNHAEFRVVVTEHTRAAKKSNYIEVVGSYNPHRDTVSLKAEKIKEWIAKGAQVSDTVFNILVSQKVIEGKKKNVLPKKTAPVKEVKEEEKKEEVKEVAKEEENIDETATV